MSDVKAGGAYVEISAREKGLQGTLNRASSRLKGFADSTESLGQKLGMAVSAAAIAAPIVASVKAFTDLGSELVDTSARTGIAVESLSALKFAADQSGASMPELEKGISKMQKTIVDAASGSGTAAKAIDAIGVSFQQLAGLSPDAQFALIAERISAIPNPTQRAAAAMEIFGKSGTKLLPLMADLDATTQAARDAGMIMSAEAAAAAEHLGDSLDLAGKAATFLAAGVGETLAPAIESIVAKLVRFVGWISDLIKTFPNATAGIAGAAAGIAALTAAIPALTMAIAALSSVWAFLLANPMTLVLAAAAAAVGALITVMSRAGTETQALADKMSALRTKGDEQRGSDLARLARLQELSQAERLNAAEMGEATALIGELQAQYGDLGISLDQTTGKITGVGDATQQLHEVMRQQAAAELDAEMAAVRKSLQETQERMGGLRTYWGQVKDFWGVDNYDDAVAQWRGLQTEMGALEERRKKLAGGDTSSEALAGDKQADGRLKVEEDAKAVEKAAKAREKAAKEMASAEEKLAALEESLADKRRTELERELNGLKKHFAEKRKLLDEMIRLEEAANDPARQPVIAGLKAQRAGVEAEEKKAERDAVAKDAKTRADEREKKQQASLKETDRAIDRQNLENDFAAQAAQITADPTLSDSAREKKLADLDREKRREQIEMERREATEDLFDERATEIEADKSLTEDQKAQALEKNRGQRQQALGEFATGDDAMAAARAAGDAELLAIEQSAEVRHKGIDIEAAADTTKTKAKLGATGTFNAAAVFGMGMGGAQERTAKATEETAKNTKKLLGRDKEGANFA